MGLLRISAEALSSQDQAVIFSRLAIIGTHWQPIPSLLFKESKPGHPPLARHIGTLYFFSIGRPGEFLHYSVSYALACPHPTAMRAADRL
jgi:hypothetical protein